jgi:hypothetical protein
VYPFASPRGGFRVRTRTVPSAKQEEIRGWRERVVRKEGEKKEKEVGLAVILFKAFVVEEGKDAVGVG